MTSKCQPHRKWVVSVLAAAWLAVAPAVPSIVGPPATLAAQAGDQARQASSGPTKVATVEGITEYVFPNGLRVLLFPDETKPMITVNVTYFVGSRHESYGETGMAHLLEHLLFKGTPNHPNIPQELTERGARPNGTTWFDRTNYFETFPASEDNLRWALELEADRMVNSFVSAEDLASEMTVVRNEFESGENSPGRVLMERTLATAYLWHNYGKSTIGARSDIENVPIERLRAFYRRYYQPDNAMLVVAGKFDEAKALEMIQETFGKIPRPERTDETRIYPTYTREPTQDGERQVTLRRVGDVQMINVAYHVPPGSHEDFAAISILAHVMGNAPSGRLYKALVEPKLATSAGAFGYQLREPGMLIFSATLRKEDSIEATRDVMLKTIEEAPTTEFTEEEVERARASLLRNWELAYNSTERVALELSEWAAMGDWRLMYIHRDRLKKVTPADVQRVAAAYLKPANRTLGMFIPTEQPDRAEIPEAPDIRALVEGYTGSTEVAEGEAFEPTPENIEARTIRFTLDSGLKIALMPKRTRGRTVVAQLTFRHGSEEALMNKGAAPGMAGAMLMRGTKNRSRQQIQDELSRLKAQANVSGGATSAGAYIETTRENFVDVLRLVAEVLREPAFDPTEFEQLKRQQLAALESQRSEPIARAISTFSAHLNPRPAGHPLRTNTIEESIAEVEAVTLEDVKNFYESFYGGSHGEIAVVGDFDPDEIRALLTELFGDWKSPQPFQRIASTYQEVEPKSFTIETPDKANAVFLAGMTFPMRDDDPDYPAMVLGNYMLGGGFLNSRLAVRIRQKDGLSYGVGSSFSAGATDRVGQWLANAIYAPQNAERLEAAFREEIERVLREGFTAEEVEAAKQGLLQSRHLSRAQDGSLARMLANGLYLDRTMQHDAELDEKIRALTPEQIHAALRRHLDLNKMTFVKAGDFANAKAAGPGTEPETQPES